MITLIYQSMYFLTCFRVVPALSHTVLSILLVSFYMHQISVQPSIPENYIGINTNKLLLLDMAPKAMQPFDYTIKTVIKVRRNNDY